MMRQRVEELAVWKPQLSAGKTTVMVTKSEVSGRVRVALDGEYFQRRRSARDARIFGMPFMAGLLRRDSDAAGWLIQD